MAQLDKYLVGLIVFVLILTTCLLVVNETQTNYARYGANMTDEKFNALNERAENMSVGLYLTSQAQKEDTLGAEITEDESWESSVKGSYSAIRLVTDSFRLVGDAFNVIVKGVGISPDDTLIDEAFYAILVISIVFSLIYLVFRFKG